MGSLEILKRGLLKQRGFKVPEKMDELRPIYERDIHDPYLMHDMKTAVNRIYQAIERAEQIVVYGDYDVDGVTSTAIMVEAIRKLGGQVVPFLPDRMAQGYGLNMEVLKSLAAEMQLLVTVDCGISGAGEVKRLKDQGIDVVVTDHHTVPDEWPEAVAIVHPMLKGYPFALLSGAGVAWKVSQALFRDKRCQMADALEAEKWLLDLACLGTVADIMPLVGENRALVYFGLKILERSRRPGLRVLLDGQSVSTEFISFRIAPLLNAAGRMKHPQMAFDLLMAETEEEAIGLAGELKRINNQRRVVSQGIQSEVLAQVGDNDTPIVFAYNEDWAPGVVGLVANKMSNKFDKPAFVVGSSAEGAVGSARAPAGINVVDLLAENKQYLVKFGGHAGAAGFTALPQNIEELKQALMMSAGKVLEAAKEEIVWADYEVDTELLDWPLQEFIETLAPFGEKNEPPVFVVRRMSLLAWRGVGKTGDHGKLTFLNRDDELGGIGFGLTERLEEQKLKSGSKVDVLFQLEVNEYMGRRDLQLNVRDIVESGGVRIVAE